EAFRTALRRLTASPAGSLAGLPADLIARLDPADRTASEAIVSRYLDDNAIELIGTRSLAEITGGLLAALADSRAEPIPRATTDLIEQYLAIRGPAVEAAQRIEGLIAHIGPRTAMALAAHHRRLDLMERAGLDVAGFEFSAEFGRSLEYYTGFVFDIISPALGPASPIAGGGRYDSLMKAVGTAYDIPAVGSAIHTERLLTIANGGIR
ncbi:MAG: ATP phosphoribosyltransferase regulatory subunit, partial [Hyphomicrobiaceae bacterium]